MSGKPAARIDDKVKYARVVTGSRTVLIGTQGGVACSVCPGGKAESKEDGKGVGNPVNAQLGAKVLSRSSDLDFALPGAMPLVWQRQYSSYVNAQHGGHCGVLGYGWGLPMDLRIKVDASATLLHDSQGRTITFDALAAGQSIYSPSEDIWLLRSGRHPGNLAQDLASMTGAAKFTEPGAADSFEAPPPRSQQAPLWWRGRFSWIRRDMACGDLLILAANGSGDTVWVFAPGTPTDLAIRANADKPIRITDTNGRDKHIAYTPTGQTASYTDCSGHSTHYEYNRWGQTEAVRNALDERVSYQYNEQDQLRSVYYPDGSMEHYQYDAQGQVVEVKAGRSNDRDGKTPISTTAASVRMAYDLWGRLTSRSHAGQHLGFAYDTAGRLTQLTNENGEHTRFSWDVMDRLTQETGFDARVQSYEYDAAGQLIQSSDGWAAEQSLATHISHYEWTVTGQLAARHLPATNLLPATTQRYEWGKVGELLQASVWHQRENDVEGPSPNPSQGQNQEGVLQSQAVIERDAAGRVIGEVQRLYKTPTDNELQNLFAVPEIEFEHRITHQLDALGNRQASQLQGLGDVGYLLYGSGHVHDITWQGESLVNFERDALHREIHRQVLTDINCTTPGENTAKPLYRKLSWDAAGRMETMQWLGLEQGSALDDMLSIPGASQGGGNTSRVPQTLLGAMSARQYYYDSLGQMVGMRSHAGISRFAYDGAGRLTGAHTPHAGSQRWQFDPAGNRLPIAGPETKTVTPDHITGHLNETDRLRAQQRAAAQANPISKEQLLRSDFNPLQADPDPTQNQPLHTSKRWAGNRVAYYENQEDASSAGAKIHYQYDSRGNRVQSLYEATGRKLELAYDSGNQLVQVRVTDNGAQTTQHYRYDAFGRRLAKYSDQGKANSNDGTGTDYFGWDGDRLIHTERFNSANAKDDDGTAQPEIIHTLYEPGSFTPLIQLRRATKAAPDLGDELLANTSPGVVQDALRSALADIKALNASLPQNIAYLSMSKDVQAFMREQLQDYEQTVSDQRKEAAEKVEIRHYLCDHLGTPNALIREDSRLDWAVQLDAWGNVRVEHNPGELYQPIRLPGQHADDETRLHYNRHRYFDGKIGSYISDDPIGLKGGIAKKRTVILIRFN